MDRKAFLIIFDRRYFIFLGVIFALVYGYSYLDDKGYIEDGTKFYNVGKVFSLQPPNSTIIEKEILRLTNEERKYNGLSPLVFDNQLSMIAKEHSQDMYQRNFFDHNNPDGNGPTERAKQKGIRVTNGNWVGIGENIGQTPIGDVIGCGYTYSEEEIAKCAVDGWMDSQGHRTNILDINYDVIGVGTYCTTSDCWNTQDFR